MAEFTSARSPQDVIESALAMRTPEQDAMARMSTPQQLAVGAGIEMHGMITGGANLVDKAFGNEARVAARSEMQRGRRAQYEAGSPPGAARVGEFLPALATAPLSGGWIPQTVIGAAYGGVAGAEGGELSQSAIQAGFDAGGTVAVSGGLNIGGRIARATMARGQDLVSAIRGPRADPRAPGGATPPAPPDTPEWAYGRGGGRGGDGPPKQFNSFVDDLRDMGYWVSRGDETGNPSIQAVEDWIANSPAYRQIIDEKIVGNQIKDAEIALDSIGAPKAGNIGKRGEIEPRVLNEQAKEIGNVFNDMMRVIDNTDQTLKLDGDLLDFVTHGSDATPGMTNDGLKVFESLQKRYPGLTGDAPIAGNQYMQIYNALWNEIKNTKKPGVAQDLLSVRNMMEEELSRIIRAEGMPGLYSELVQARLEWRNLMALSSRNVISKTDRTLNPTTLYNYLEREGGAFFSMGDDLRPLARMARSRTRLNSYQAGSPTHRRQQVQAAVNDPVRFALGATAGRGVVREWMDKPSPMLDSMMQVFESPAVLRRPGVAGVRGGGGDQ